MCESIQGFVLNWVEEGVLILSRAFVWKPREYCGDVRIKELSVVIIKLDRMW